MESSITNQEPKPPGEPPSSSQQGCICTCVAHSLAKCICAAGEKRNPKINFLQSEVISSCVTLGGEKAAKNGSWPDGDEWNGKYILPKENGVLAGAACGPTGKTYKVTFTIHQCSHADYNAQNEYVLVLLCDQCPAISAESGLHCVYITGTDGTFWSFLNSHGSQSELKIAIGNVHNKLYKVTTDIQELRKDDVLNISSTGAAGIVWHDLMGTYRIVPGMSYGNHPVWKMDGKEHRLGVNMYNRWAILQNNHQEVMGNMTLPAPDSPAGLPTSWMYLDVSTMTWKEDQLLKIEIHPGTAMLGQPAGLGVARVSIQDDQFNMIQSASGTKMQGQAAGPDDAAVPIQDKSKYFKPIEELTKEDKNKFLVIISGGIGKAAPGKDKELANQLGLGNSYKERKIADDMRRIPKRQTVRDMLEEEWLGENGDNATIHSMIVVLEKIKLKRIVHEIENNIPNS